jgi:hypothetical protein
MQDYSQWPQIARVRNFEVLQHLWRNVVLGAYEWASAVHICLLWPAHFSYELHLLDFTDDLRIKKLACTEVDELQMVVFFQNDVARF